MHNINILKYYSTLYYSFSYLTYLYINRTYSEMHKIKLLLVPLLHAACQTASFVKCKKK